MSIHRNGLTSLLFIFVTAMSLSACAGSHKKEEQANNDHSQGGVSLPIMIKEGRAYVEKAGRRTEISPYLVSFDNNGNVILFDLEGNLLSPDGELPFKPESPIKEIQQVSDIKIIRAVGSHYDIVLGSRGYYIRPLPH